MKTFPAWLGQFRDLHFTFKGGYSTVLDSMPGGLIWGVIPTISVSRTWVRRLTGSCLFTLLSVLFYLDRYTLEFSNVSEHNLKVPNCFRTSEGSQVFENNVWSLSTTVPEQNLLKVLISYKTKSKVFCLRPKMVNIRQRCARFRSVNRLWNKIWKVGWFCPLVRTNLNYQNDRKSR